MKPQTPLEMPPIAPLSMEEEIQQKFMNMGFMHEKKDLNSPITRGEALLIMNRLFDSLRLK